MMVTDPYTNENVGKGRVLSVCPNVDGIMHCITNVSKEHKKRGGGISTLESNHKDELTRRDRAALIRYDQVTAICFQSGEQPHNELLSCMVTHKRASDISKR